MMNAAPVPLGDGARMSFLYRDPKNYADPNGNSVVVRLDLGAKRILLAGDAEGGERELPSEPPQPNSIEAKLLACCATDLKSDVLVVGHHGRSEEHTSELQSLMRISYAVFCLKKKKTTDKCKSNTH